MLSKSAPKVAPIELVQSSFESPDVSAQNSQPHGYQNLPYMRAARPNSKSTTQKCKHIVHFPSPRKLRRDVHRDTSETDPDAVFQGLQNRQRDLF